MVKIIYRPSQRCPDDDSLKQVFYIQVGTPVTKELRVNLVNI